MSTRKYNPGHRFDRLTLIQRETFLAICRCDCGNELRTTISNLRSGHTRSCGCLRREVTIARSKKHGFARRGKKCPTYQTWCGLWKRCTNPKCKDWPNYGGRGITVCVRWKSFTNFLTDMGEKPKSLMLERKKNNRGYYKANCMWATRLEQNNNTRANHFVRHNGQRLTLAQWSRKTGVSAHEIGRRLRRGVKFANAISI